MKFICDEMLAKLGKWLRAAGYDTVMAKTSSADQNLVDLALKENRCLITRDRHFLKIKSIEGCLLWLEGNGVEECAGEISRKIAIDWTFNPFSRCLVCNEEFQKPSVEDLDKVPSDVRESSEEFWYCPRCDQVFWRGSHTERMMETLERWNRNRGQKDGCEN